MSTVRKTPPTDDELVRLFNQTEGSFMHDIVLEDGTRIHYKLPANSFAKVPPEVAELWLEMYPHRIVKDSEAHAKVNAAHAELATANKRIAELEKQLAAKGDGKSRKVRSDEVV